MKAWQAEEIAAAVVWLCSGAASFVNGHAGSGRRRGGAVKLSVVSY
jgi:hypothetical protein